MTRRAHAIASLPFALGVALFVAQLGTAAAGLRLPGPVQPLFDVVIDAGIIGLCAIAVWRRSRPRLSDVTGLAGLGSVEFDFARQSADWSPEAARLHGLHPDHLQTRLATLQLVVHPEDRYRLAAAVRVAQDRNAQVHEQYRVVRPNGETRNFELRGHVVGDVLHASVQDVTVWRHPEDRLRRSEARYRLVLENAQDGIWITDRDERTVFVNARMCELLGVPPTGVLGRAPSEFIAETSDRRPVLEQRVRHVEARFRRPDGPLVWASVSSSCNDAWAGGWAMVVTDITPRKRLEDQLRRAACQDDLTGLPNRRAFGSLVDASADPQGLAVALIDLDHFKFVNDSLGHVIGDELVRHVADVLAAELGEDGTLARFGGDEFAVMLPGADRARGEAVIERLLRAVRQSGWRAARSVTASAGLAIGSPSHACARDLLRAADIALFEAKDAGRDRSATYRGPRGGLAWVDEVRSAIDEGRLVLFSQPIVPLHDGGRPREELLVRMVKRDGDVLSPASFVPTAEQFGLAYGIDRWVLERALELAAAGRAVELNISAATVGDDRIVGRLTEAVGGGIDPSLLTFEITETAAFRNLDAAFRFAQAITGRGRASRSTTSGRATAA